MPRPTERSPPTARRFAASPRPTAPARRTAAASEPTADAAADGTPTDSTPTDSTSTDAAPTAATPTDPTATSTDAAPTDSTSTDATSTESTPTSTDAAPTEPTSTDATSDRVDPDLDRRGSDRPDLDRRGSDRADLDRRGSDRRPRPTGLRPSRPRPTRLRRPTSTDAAPTGRPRPTRPTEPTSTAVGTDTAADATAIASATTAATGAADDGGNWTIVAADGADHAISLNATATDAVVTIDGAATSRPLAGLLSITVTGGNGADTFTVDLTGIDAPVTVDGGSDGFDTLVLQNSSGSLSFTPTDGHSGTITVGGKHVTYGGLDPILIPGGTMTDVVFDLGALGDDAVLSQSGTQLTLASVAAVPTFEGTTFTLPSSSLTVNGGDGVDKITIQGALTLGATALTISAETILVPTGAAVQTSGNITFTAYAKNVVASTTPVASTPTTAQVAVSGSVQAGGDVKISATVEQLVSMTGQVLNDASNTATLYVASTAIADVLNGGSVTAATLALKALSTTTFTYDATAPALSISKDVLGVPVGIDGLANDGSVSLTVNNKTWAGVSGGTVTVGAGASPNDPALEIAAKDELGVDVKITDTNTDPLAGVTAFEAAAAFLTFDRLVSSMTLSRDTQAYVRASDVGQTHYAATLTTPGLVQMTAQNTGSVKGQVVSQYVGKVTISATKDDASAAITDAESRRRLARRRRPHHHELRLDGEGGRERGHRRDDRDGRRLEHRRRRERDAPRA